MKARYFLISCLLIALLPLSAQNISLAGRWDFRMGDTGESTIPNKYDDSIMLPGSMLTNGKGNPVNVNTKWTGSLYDSSFYYNPYMEKYRHEGRMKFPFFLTPERHYVGTAWYHRKAELPTSWKGKKVTLFLERPHIETTIFVNGKEVGHQLSLSVPHRYDISDYLNFGENNDIDICVYNGMENVCVGQDSHSVTDQTQGNWNGIVGRLELQADTQPKFRILPNISEGEVTIEIDGERHLLKLGKDIRLWSEHDPYLYTREIMHQGKPVSVTFGVREIEVEGRQILLNGKPLYLRGTVENCCFPETGYPPMDEQEWLRIFRKCKEYGLNHMRFHSYCPPEAAFKAADEVGFYLQPEGPTWPNHGVSLRSGQKIDEYLMEESKRIVDEYGHHPSFVMMAAGNEPAGDWVHYCNQWVIEMKKYDPTKIYAGASVGGGWAWDSEAEYHVKGGARGLDEWNRCLPSSDDDYYNLIEFPRNYKGSEPNQSPLISHEKGQWCAFPDFREIQQYKGVYKARNFEIFRDLLRDNGMQEMAEKFLMASGHLQTLCYKYEIERNLRTKDYAGFQLLGLNDYSGQGTALTGVLNVFWREKGYCTSADWSQFCNTIVPLARFPKFVFTTDETLSIPVEAYNASGSSLSNAKASYTIENEYNIIASGLLFEGTLSEGKNITLGTVSMSLNSIREPSKMTLTIQFSPTVKNSWDFWVYPKEIRDEESKKIKNFYETDTLDDKALKQLKRGGIVLLTAGGKVRYGNDVRHNFLPVFWNTSWFKMRPPHTTGAYIQKEHPVFRHFPTDDWQNLNWWELTNRTQVINLTEFPANYQPIVQPIDTWHVSRKLGMLIEVKVLKGRLLMTTMDISHDLDNRPVAQQLRYSILRYIQSSDFQPSTTVSPEVIRHLFEREAPKVNMFTKDSPDELKPKIAEPISTETLDTLINKVSEKSFNVTVQVTASP